MSPSISDNEQAVAGRQVQRELFMRKRRLAARRGLSGDRSLVSDPANVPPGDRLITYASTMTVPIKLRLAPVVLQTSKSRLARLRRNDTTLSNIHRLLN